MFNERREIQCDGLNEMPKIMRNLILLQEDCGEVCDTSDENFKKIPGNPFDTMKKEFECDILLTRWFSVGICKYKPGYKSHDLL